MYAWCIYRMRYRHNVYKECGACGTTAMCRCCQICTCTLYIQWAPGNRSPNRQPRRNGSNSHRALPHTWVKLVCTLLYQHHTKFTLSATESRRCPQHPTTRCPQHPRLCLYAYSTLTLLLLYSCFTPTLLPLYTSTRYKKLQTDHFANNTGADGRGPFPALRTLLRVCQKSEQWGIVCRTCTCHSFGIRDTAHTALRYTLSQTCDTLSCIHVTHWAA